MSTVIPVPAGAIAGLVSLVVLAELDVPEPAAAVASAAVGVGVLFGWAMSERLPNGGGPM